MTPRGRSETISASREKRIVGVYASRVVRCAARYRRHTAATSPSRWRTRAALTAWLQRNKKAQGQYTTMRGLKAHVHECCAHIGFAAKRLAERSGASGAGQRRRRKALMGGDLTHPRRAGAAARGAASPGLEGRVARAHVIGECALYSNVCLDQVTRAAIGAGRRA